MLNGDASSDPPRCRHRGLWRARLCRLALVLRAASAGDSGLMLGPYCLRDGRSSSLDHLDRCANANCEETSQSLHRPRVSAFGEILPLVMCTCECPIGG